MFVAIMTRRAARALSGVLLVLATAVTIHSLLFRRLPGIVLSAKCTEVTSGKFLDEFNALSERNAYAFT